MLFNSKTFLLFFAVVYAVYLLLRRRHRWQNAFLFVASLVFYGSWNWRFLFLIAASTGIDYYLALKIHACPRATTRKRYLLVSVGMNLIVLGFFKYFNFFADSFVELMRMVGLSPSRVTLSIALPVGISFYTFQAISYVVDVYRKQLEPVRSPLDYGLFIVFFPHLVAGPIQRPSVLLPQVIKPRTVTWDQVYAGSALILWGYYKKIVIADNLALIVNPIFDRYLQQTSLDIGLGALAFAFQIYADFSAYSDIARGLSKLMGFELVVNFKLPYFSVNPTDFWLRWHVSLSTWLRDYLFLPTAYALSRHFERPRYAGIKADVFTYGIASMVTMVLGGLWHGAAWTFVLWGAFHGLLLAAYRIVQRKPDHANPWKGGGLAYLRAPLEMGLMFGFILVGWILFRSRSLHQAWTMVSHLGFTPSTASAEIARKLALFCGPLLGVQIFQYAKRDLLAPAKLPIWVVAPAAGVLLALMTIFGVRESMEFIYFQF
jgi:alginate O-acetyltransferase complex protein AlgI